jgi:hypothetical protein
MSNVGKINTNDTLRPLMTEVLPYETPLWFSNTIIHRRCTQNPKVFDKFFKGSHGPLKPLDYRIKRTKSGTRSLSIMHPVIQLEACEFYDTYKDLIIYYCSKSPCTLRHPSKTASAFKSKTHIGIPNGRHGVEETDRYSEVCSSFFAYGKYAFLYRFYESYEYQSLEKKFKRMTQVDIAKCFHGIYTHSISWATKSKRVAKRDKAQKGGFDRNFDALMQKANYLETNGILIGPEVSRIFAEIILQEIDQRVISRMSLADKKLGHDYDFRRYVDDYFFFTNNDEAYDLAIRILEEELAFFKLHLNEEKTQQIQRPFITDISLFKEEFSNSIDNLYGQRINSDGTISIPRNPSRLANRSITSIKAIVKRHNIKYSSVSNYLLSVAQRKVADYTKSVQKAHTESLPTKNSYKWILVDLDIIFFVHAMDPRVVPTDRIAKTVKMLLSISEQLFPDGTEMIRKKIFDLSRKSIEIFDDSNELDFSVEILNILLVLSQLGEKHQLPPSFLDEHFVERLREFKFGSEESYDTNGGFYFLWVSLMLYIKDRPQFETIRQELSELGTNFIINCPMGFRSTETFLFFFDFISCKYVTSDCKKELAQTIIEKENLNISKKTLLSDYNTKGLVVNWSESNWFEKSLLKRDYLLAYE